MCVTYVLCYANVGMLAHFVLGRAIEGKSRQDKTRQDKTRQDKTRQEIAAEEIYGPHRPMAPKRSEINA